MDFSNEPFEVEFTDECIKELIDIYEYISNNLKEDNIAKKLMTEMLDRVLILEDLPELYMKIGKADKLKREYRIMVVKNYVVLYTVDYKKRTVFIVHIINGKRNYLN